MKALFTLLFLLSQAAAQLPSYGGLVPSMERTGTCPAGMSGMTCELPPGYGCHIGTPDNWDSCAQWVPMPVNQFGNFAPALRMIGIYGAFDGGTHPDEWFWIRLIKPMQAGDSIEIRLTMKPAPASMYVHETYVTAGGDTATAFCLLPGWQTVTVNLVPVTRADTIYVGGFTGHKRTGTGWNTSSYLCFGHIYAGKVN